MIPVEDALTTVATELPLAAAFVMTVTILAWLADRTLRILDRELGRRRHDTPPAVVDTDPETAHNDNPNDIPEG